MRVEEIMTKDPACCMPDSKLHEVAQLMADRDVGQIPVVDSASRKPVGVVTDRDITVRAVARGRNPLDLTVRDVMSSPAVTTTPDANLEDAARMLEERRLGRLQTSSRKWKPAWRAERPSCMRISSSGR